MKERKTTADRFFGDKDWAYGFAQKFVLSKLLDQIKETRIQRGISVEEFLKMAGRDYISADNDHCVDDLSIHQLFKIAKHLGIMVDIEFKTADRFYDDSRDLPEDWLELKDFNTVAEGRVK